MFYSVFVDYFMSTHYTFCKYFARHLMANMSAFLCVCTHMFMQVSKSLVPQSLGKITKKSLGFLESIKYVHN